MIRYILRRLFYGGLVLFGVVTIVFFLFNVKPGDASLLVAGNHATEESIESIKKEWGLNEPLLTRYFLYLNDLSPISLHNKNVPESKIYLDEKKYSYISLLSLTSNRTFVLKVPYLRRSYYTGKSVGKTIQEKLPDTVILAVTSIVLAILLGISLGVLAALNKGQFVDNASLIFGVLGMSVPSYLSGILISWLGGTIWADTMHLPLLPIFCLLLGLSFGVIMHKKKRERLGATRKILGTYLLETTVKGLLLGMVLWGIGMIINGYAGSDVIPGIAVYANLPGTGLDAAGSLVDVDPEISFDPQIFWSRLILPTITLGIRPLAIVMQLTRSSMLDALSQDYVRTAKAKGLSQTKVIFKHTLKNALNPVLTAVSGWFASLLAGAVFVERVFDWNGIGNELVDSVLDDDLPMAMGITMVIALFFVLINILVDITYGLLDPRVRIN